MNEHNVTEESKSAAVKTLAIIGFIALIMLGVWLAIQAVRIIPSAFSSLASIADSIQTNRPVDTLTIATEKSVANTGESVLVSFTDLGREGTYSISYQCVDGVSFDINTGDESTALDCDDAFILPDNTFEFVVVASSEKRRFIDVPFTIAFTQRGEDETMFEKNAKLTVVNVSIPQSSDIAAENGDNQEGGASEPSTPRSGSQSAAAGGAVSTPTQAERTISIIPTSDPSGFTDLRVIYLGVGILEGTTFVPQGSLDTDERAALRFEVRNIGTKTSDEWTFEALLPNGVTFTSDEQVGLKPNERATLTIGFSVSETGMQDIRVEVDVPNDTDTSNNDFDWAVEVTN